MQDGLHSWHSVQLTPEHALEVAALLERAWSVPSLHYTPEFIAWQMSFPGSPPFVGFRADRGELVACGGASFRQAILPDDASGAPFFLALISFVAVDPQWRGRGLAREVYRKLLTDIEVPVLTFALQNSPGAKLIESVYAGLGFDLHSLALCRIYARSAVVDPGGWNLGAVEILPTRPKQLPAGGLYSFPSPAEWAHQQKDPRPHVLCRWGDAVAWICAQEVRGVTGIHRQAFLESTWGMCAEDLPSLAGFCALQGAACGESNLLQAGNLSFLPAEDLRRGGWRQISIPFSSWWAMRKGTKQLAPPLFSNFAIV